MKTILEYFISYSKLTLIHGVYDGFNADFICKCLLQYLKM